jgi:cadmium resistance protein CadD (predicted permease)
MGSYFSGDAIWLAILAFGATTIDDLAVLLLFFSKHYVKTKNIYDPETAKAFRQIVIGQIIGFTLVVGISLGLGIGLREAVSDGYIDLIGFLPILIGTYKIYEILEDEGYLECFWNFLCCIPKSEIDEDNEETPPPVGEKLPLIDDKMLDDKEKGTSKSFGATDDIKQEKDINQDEGAMKDDIKKDPLEDSNEVETKSVSCFAHYLNPLVMEVCLYSLLFGTDNIAIYVSLFSNMTNVEILFIVVIFYVLLFLFICFAILIVTQVSFTLYILV